jgi:hypothetical protein
MNKNCKTCKEIKDVSLFYNTGALKDGSAKYHPSCKSCVLEYNRTLYRDDPSYRQKRKERCRNIEEDAVIKNKQRSSDFYKSINGRTLTLLKSANRRACNFKEACDLDYDFLYNKLENGVCEVTGIAFDFNKPEQTCKNPYAPSIDRIDSTIGYIKSNTRIVIWQYNLMKGELSDKELLILCKLILERSKDGLDL